MLGLVWDAAKYGTDNLGYARCRSGTVSTMGSLIDLGS